MQLPKKLKKILIVLKENGISPIIVGGSVRDFLLKIATKDYDIELYGLNNIEKVENILSRFGKVVVVGKSFGVLKLQTKNFEFDFSLPRIEKKIKLGHRGFEIFNDETIDFKTASKRRDFTINSIGYDYFGNKFLDPFGAICDLKDKKLKVVNANSFKEDALRVYRAVQFCARFDLKIDKRTLKVCKKIVKSNEFETISNQRVFIEFKKLLYSSNPSIGFKLLKKMKIISKHFKEIETINRQSWKNLLKSIDKIAKNKDFESQKRFYFILCIMSCNLQKDSIEIFLKKVTNEKKSIQNVVEFVNIYNANKNIFFKNPTNFDIKFFAKRVNIKEFCFICKVLKTATKSSIVNFLQKAKKLNVLNKAINPLVNGDDLIAQGFKPSKEFSKILEYAYILQLKNENLDKNNILKQITNLYIYQLK